MKQCDIAVTGSRGFIGKNLMLQLERVEGVNVLPISHTDELSSIREKVQKADIIFHLAGVNRPEKEEEFQTGNVDFLKQIVEFVSSETGKAKQIYLSSSTQAEKENPYGSSKKSAEEFLKENAADNLKVHIARVPNVFGKFCRPNYNSVVATFCHNIQRGLPITINNPQAEVELIYIDDLVSSMVQWSQTIQSKNVLVKDNFESVQRISLGKLAETLNEYFNLRDNLNIPAYPNAFYKNLHATFQSYMAEDKFAYNLNKRVDDRGYLAEFVKSQASGQIFVSKTKPGITRGNHYHHTKLEKFYVVDGDASVKFRHMYSDEVIEYVVNGDEARVIDIPPGYTHSITNIGKSDLITIFWANEIFDQQRPDTYFTEVEK